MPYETPIISGGTWVMEFTHPLTGCGFLVGAQGDNQEGDRDAGMQAFIDFIEQSPDYAFSTAYKTYAGQAPITPTP